MNMGADIPTGRDRPPDTNIHVLCVETDETVGEHLESHLDTSHVRTVRSPREALTDVRDGTVPVDCLVSEYQLPEMDGLAFLEAVRAENPTLPFILFTGSGSETLASNAISANVTDYVRKDVESPYDRLATRISEAVAQPRPRRAHEAGHEQPTPDEHLDRRAVAMDAAMDGMAILNADDEYVYVNQAHADIYGYDSPADLVGETWHCLYDDAEVQRFQDAIFPVVRETGHWRGEAVGMHTDGTTFPQEVSLTALPDGGLVCVVRDITDRTKRKRELKTLRRRYELVVQASTDAFWDWNPQTNEITRSEDYLGQFGYEPGDIGPAVDWWAERIHPDDRDRVQTALDRALADPDRNYDETYRFQRTDGTYGYIRSRGTVVYDEAGDPKRMVGAHIDITDSKERERAVESLHEATRAMMEATDRQAVTDRAVDTARDVLGLSVSALWVHTDDAEAERLEPVAWTDEAADVVGQHPTYPAEETSLSWSVFETGEAQLIADMNEHPRRYNPETPIRSEIIVPIGDHGVMNISATEPDAFDETDVVLAQLLAANTRTALDRIDRTEALRDRTATLERQNRYLSQFYMLMTDPERAFETKRQDMLALGCDHFGFAVGLLARLTDTTAEIDEVHAPGVPLLPGTTIDLPAPADDLVPSADAADEGVIQTPTADEDDQPVLQARFGFEAYLQVPVYVGGERYGLLVFGSPQAHDDPLDDASLTLAKFVTRWLDYELTRQQTRRELERQTDALETRTGQLAFFNSILRHDVLNGMTVIGGRAELLAEDLEGAPSEHAETIERWADDVTDLVKRVRAVVGTLTAPDDQPVEPVDLSPMVHAELDRIAQTYSGVTVEREIPDGVLVQADEMLAEVVGNVVTNAVEHNDPDGLRVAVRIEPGEPVRVRIADNGRGIPADRREAVFRRGETGKETSPDTGFGLYFVGSMVTAYGGDVWIEDADLGGAAVVLEMPPAETTE